MSTIGTVRLTDSPSASPRAGLLPGWWCGQVSCFAFAAGYLAFAASADFAVSAGLAAPGPEER